MQVTSEKMLFQSENYQYMEQVASQCCGGFLRQLFQETTGARMWNYKRCLHPLLLLLLLQVTTYKLRYLMMSDIEATLLLTLSD